MSPAMTRPLSKTRSRMSTRPCDRVGFTSSGNRGLQYGSREVLSQSAKRTEIDIQILIRQAKCVLQLTHAMVQLQERHPESFDLFLGQRSAVHPPNRLVFQHFA